MKRRAKIAIVGCGALGSYYGARLSRLGHEVWFLSRSDYEVVRSRGVEIRDATGGFRAHPEVARRPEDIGACDWVVIGLKTTADAAFPELVPPLLGADTAVLTLQNGLGSAERLATLVGAERVLAGLCFVGLNRLEPGVVYHHAYGRIVLGEFGRPVSTRATWIAGEFEASGVPCRTVDRLEQAQWEKLVWNIPFNGLGVAAAAGYACAVRGQWTEGSPLGPCAATDVLLGDSRWLALVRELMMETITGARAQGLQVAFSQADEQIARTREMGPYKASTLLDFEAGRPLEVDTLFSEPLRRLRAAGASAPRLSALEALLVALDPARRVGDVRPTGSGTEAVG